MTIVGNGPSPFGGSVTSTSSGTPSKLATRSASPVVGQKRAPSFGAQAWPNGVGGAAAAEAGSRPSVKIARARRRDIGGTLLAEQGGSAGCRDRRRRSRQRRRRSTADWVGCGFDPHHPALPSPTDG